MKNLSLFLLSALLMVGLFSCETEKYPDLEDGIYAEVQTTYGNILVKLHHEKAPLTVANFVGLAEGSIENEVADKGEPYYDSIKIHRVVPGFVIQSGDPEGTGQGGPGYSFPDEFHPDLKHSGAGILSMANAGPNTNGSQFFITLKATPNLDDRHSVFGKVVEGMSVVDSLGAVETTGPRKDQPVPDLYVEHIEIIRKGADAESFDAPKVFEEKKAEKEQEMAEAQAAEAKAFQDFVQQNYPNHKTTQSGLMYVIDEKGTGASPSPGDTVSVHYEGTFTDGKVFDSSYKRGDPLKFPIGMGQVIPGWDEGMMLFKEGGKGTLIVPYPLAYGEQGYPGAIPPRSNLVFKVELVKVHK